MRIGQAVDRFEPRRMPLAFSRTALALAQLAVIVLNPDTILFAGTIESFKGMRCDGVRAVSLWCLTSGMDYGALIARITAIVVLAIVSSGFRPRWTCVPHWYVTYSLAASMSVANGGDRIAQIATMLFIPLCLGDDRLWQWTPVVSPLSSAWRGSAFAAYLAIRCQIFLIYMDAAVSKTMDPLWRQGSGMYVISADPYYGFPVAIQEYLAPVLGSFWPVAIMTWAVIAVQLFIAVAVVCGPQLRRIALVLGIGLHLAIAVLMHLPTFSLVMIALLVVGCAPLVYGESVGRNENGVHSGGYRGRVVRARPGE